MADIQKESYNNSQKEYYDSNQKESYNDVEKETYSDGGGLQKTISQESHLSDQEHIDVFTPEEQRKIIRRIDIRLVTTLGFMYCVSLMDRTVSLARITHCLRYTDDMSRIWVS